MKSEEIEYKASKIRNQASTSCLETKHEHYTCTRTDKQTDEAAFRTMNNRNLPETGCLAGINFFFPLCLPPPYHGFSQSSFLLRSVCRCTRPQSCMLTPVSERIGMYDKHKSPLFSLCPTFTPHHLESIKDHFKADMKGKAKTERLSRIVRPINVLQHHNNAVKQADTSSSQEYGIIQQHRHLLVWHIIFVQTTRAQSGGGVTCGEVMLGKGATSHTRTTKHTHVLATRKGAPSIPDVHLLSRHVAPSVFPRTDGFCRLGGHGTTITSRRV